MNKVGITDNMLEESDNFLSIILRLAMRLDQTQSALEETVDALLILQQQHVHMEQNLPPDQSDANYPYPSTPPPRSESTTFEGHRRHRSTIARPQHLPHEIRHHEKMSQRLGPF